MEQQKVPGSLPCTTCSSKPVKVESAPTETTTKPQSQDTTQLQSPTTPPNAGSASNMENPNFAQLGTGQKPTVLTLKVTPPAEGAGSFVLTGILTSEGKGLGGKDIYFNFEHDEVIQNVKHTLIRQGHVKTDKFGSYTTYAPMNSKL